MPNSTSVVDSNQSANLRGGRSFPHGKSEKAAAEPARDPHRAPLLQDIDFVEAVGEPRSSNPVDRHNLVREKMATWRQVFLDGLTRQICLARDPGFRYPRQKFVERDGVTGRAIVYLAPQPWWFDKDGTVHLRLSFGERNWCVKGKNPVIRVGTMRELLPTLEKLHILVGTGDFDEIIEKMVIVSQR